MRPWSEYDRHRVRAWPEHVPAYCSKGCGRPVYGFDVTCPTCHQATLDELAQRQRMLPKGPCGPTSVSEAWATSSEPC